MLETLAETIRSAREAVARARTAIDNARRIIEAVRGTRVRAIRLREEAARLHTSSRYNRQR